MQDQIVVALPEGVEPKAYVPRDWDKKSLEALRAKYREEAKQLPNMNATSGAHGEVDPHLLRLGVSVAMGLLPPENAVYLWRDYGLKGGECYSATYTKPGFKDKGFYSFTMYGSDRYLHDEDSTLNNRTIKDNPDGTFTIYYGPESACGKVANRLGTPGDNWYPGMRRLRIPACAGRTCLSKHRSTLHQTRQLLHDHLDVLEVLQQRPVGRIDKSVALAVYGEPYDVAARFRERDRALDVDQRLWLFQHYHRLIGVAHGQAVLY